LHQRIVAIGDGADGGATDACEDGEFEAEIVHWLLLGARDGAKWRVPLGDEEGSSLYAAITPLLI